MSQSVTPKLLAYPALVALGLFGALVLGRPELVAVVAPFALMLIVGVAGARRPEVEVAFRLATERTVESEPVGAELVLTAAAGLDQCEVLLALPAGLAVEEADNPAAYRLAAGEARTIPLVLRARRWGRYQPGDIYLRVRDRFGLFEYEAHADRRADLKVYPSAESLRALVRPRDTRAFAGNQVARLKGDGIEFADVRPFLPGDRVKRINWRASARRGGLWVNEHHPERNTDVVLFLDTFAEVRTGSEGTLEAAVRAATALAEAYLARRDRVGVVRFGGALHWLLPGMGPSQLLRIVEGLLEADVLTSFADKSIAVIPPRTLPPRALVLAITPLLDERGRAALLDLRARGYDLAIVEVSPLPFVAPPADRLEALALRLWRLERQTIRAGYERLGVAVVEWDERRTLAGVVEEVAAFRRSARQVRA